MNTATATRRKSKPPAATPMPDRPAEDQFRGNAPPLTRVGRSDRSGDSTAITVIPLGQIDRHPLNRSIDPSSDEIKQLAQSIAEHGQLEPLRVRPLGNRYQLISGERRYHALTLAQSYGAKCIVVECDDATALKEVAAINSNRQDLNPVERGELMKVLMRPVDEGGSGLSLTEAGAIFGLSSESGAKNALRLLKLPKPILDLVCKGDLPERQARKLIPYVAAPAIMKELVEALTGDKPYDRSELMAELQEDTYAFQIRDQVRPLSPGVEYWHGYNVGGNQECLFDWEPHREKLQVVELPTNLGYDQKKKRNIIEPRLYALNCKLWDKLQSPEIERLIEEGKSKAKATTPRSGEKAKPLTPKQAAEAEKKRAAEAEKRLETFTRDWIQQLMRCAIAERSINDDLVARTLPWLTSHCMASSGQSLNYYAEQALIELQLPMPKSNGRCDHLGIVANCKKETGQSFQLLAAYWRLILWPVSELISDKAERKCVLTPAGELPQRLLYIRADELASLAKLAQVSIDTAWKAAAVDGSDARRLVSVWLCRHTKDQLHKLRSELNVTEGSSTMGRQELAGCILNAHRMGKPLPVPKRLHKAAT